MGIALLNYTGKQLVPAYHAEDAVPISVNFAPNLTIQQGQVVGQITNATANDVQTLTVTATGATFTLSLVGIDGNTYTTAALAYNITAANLATAVTALAESAGFHLATATVTGGPGDGTGSAPYVITWGGAMAGYPMPVLTATSALTGAGAGAAIVHTTPGNTLGKFTAYNANNTDGSQVAVGLAPASFKTDALGRVIYGNVPLLPPFISNDLSVPIYVTGFFFTQDLVGLDTTAITAIGRLVVGSTTNGVLFLR